MGRILEALRQSDRGAQPAQPPQPELRCVSEPETGEEANVGEAEPGDEVPFIEVGPRKSMNASPGVLASPAPSPYGPRLILPTRVDAPPTSQPAPAPSPVTEVRHVPERLRSRLGPELIAYQLPDHAVSQQYRRLVEPLLTLAPTPRSQALLFSSARPGCGTTTFLLNMAISAARHARRRVAVVDGNWRHPALAERLGLGETGGLRDVLAGSLSLERALRETDQVNLFALTAGKTASSAPPGGVRCVSETMRSLLRQLRQRFDLILVDGPRWDGQQDVVLLGTACDAVYLVVAENETESAQVDDLYQAIPEQGCRLAGCLVVG